MRSLAIMALVVALGTTGACRKTGEGEYEVEKPVVGTETDTVHTPSVDVGTTRDTIAVPEVDVKTKKKEVKVPDVDVRSSEENARAKQRTSNP